MRHGFRGYLLAAAMGSIGGGSAAQPPKSPATDLAAVVQAFLAKDANTDWSGLDKLPSFRWTPPKSLTNCLPDGGCYVREGAATIAGKSLVLRATGARTIVSYMYLQNGSAPFGEAEIVAALKASGLNPELARCPVKAGVGGANWYRLTSESVNPGVLQIRTNCNGRPCEALVMSRSEELPQLQPNQVSMYSEQCSAGVSREPVSRLKPHQHLAEGVVALLVPAAGPALIDWNGLAGLSTGITWTGDGPKAMDLKAAYNDPNPMMRPGEASYGGRKFSAMATGTASQVKLIRLEESGLHPRGEHMLGVVYEKGIAVKLVRCGPIYTESTNNWYSLTSARTRPAMIRQSIRYDGNQVQDTYELRLDGTLPPRDPRDRDPGVNGCR
jgi:hypothetical protein